MNKALPFLEQSFTLALAIGLLLNYFDIDTTRLISISLAGLGVTFFMLSFKPVDIKSTDGELMGFKELLGIIMVPKVLGISSAIALVGILFFHLDLGNDGYKQMLTLVGQQ